MNDVAEQLLKQANKQTSKQLTVALKSLMANWKMLFDTYTHISSHIQLKPGLGVSSYNSV